MTPTRAAILGQLTYGPQTAYELNAAMSQNIRYVWPRAHSHVYREVKYLARDGLAHAEHGSTGRRPRTVYSPTEAGRAALARWLASSPGAVALEHEPLLRVMFASSGRREDVLAAATHARELAEDLLAIGRRNIDLYLAGEHERQADIHLRVLWMDYLYRWAELSADWAAWVEREVGDRNDLAATEERTERALERLRGLLGDVPPPPPPAPRHPAPGPSPSRA